MHQDLGSIFCDSTRVSQTVLCIFIWRNVCFDKKICQRNWALTFILAHVYVSVTIFVHTDLSIVKIPTYKISGLKKIHISKTFVHITDCSLEKLCLCTPQRLRATMDWLFILGCALCYISINFNLLVSLLKFSNIKFCLLGLPDWLVVCQTISLLSFSLCLSY